MNALSIQKNMPVRSITPVNFSKGVEAKHDERLEQVAEKIDPKTYRQNKMISNVKNRREEWAHSILMNKEYADSKDHILLFNIYSVPSNWLHEQ